MVSERMDYEVTTIEVTAARIVGVRQRVDFASSELSTCIGTAYGRVYAVIGPGPHPGHNVISYKPLGATTAEMTVGRHFEGPAPAELVDDVLPGRTVAHTRHVGPYEGLPAAHRAIAWPLRGLRATGS